MFEFAECPTLPLPNGFDACTVACSAGGALGVMDGLKPTFEGVCAP